ncbi:putative amidohydrolase [Tepidamorphus gemmatus]|uniref:Putative amidohydrolase n=1 Tax=Tepidamorphus gemmatus TaxID=747076 RepID=A0A4R3MCA0_9HYPH|nr:nitrilase-related carbon-nitrogen hydrolase [Tepidamorphus gemmatus]TCT09879.1 putative amidohydrolase [Tepidamorphus gemmatus]
MTDTLTLALWATNLSAPLTGLEAWAARIDAKLAEAARAGADLLIMPEYACEQWLSFKPTGLAPTAEIGWMAAQAPQALEMLKPLPARHGVALLAGTMPWTVNGSQRNRAWLMLPDGRAIAQDKMALTPGEQDPESWTLATGDEIAIVEWRGLKIATLICLDVEMPALSSLLAPQGIDLLMVPSMTGLLSGYSRVFGCAKARAVELMTVVAATGCVGTAPGTTQNETNVSGCAVFVPCERELGFTGVFAATDPVGAHDGDGPFLIARDLPIGLIRRKRAGAAEVWPGAWSAAHVRVRRC